MKLLTLTICLSAAAASFAATPLDALRKEIMPDSRQAVFEVRLDTLPTGRIALRGVASEASAKDTMLRRLRDLGIEADDSVRVYPSGTGGLVSIPAASLRTRGAHSAEMATQAVMGTPLRLLEHSGEWWRVQTPDGYIAWVPESSVAVKSAEEMERWRSDASRYIVTSPWQTRAWTSPEASGPRDVVTDLVLGAIVQADPSAAAGGRMPVILPDGRKGWADKADLAPIADWASQPFDAQKILSVAYSMEGTPYLWGGTSVKAIDCSGLVKVSYFANGLILRRDASQQALAGERLEADAWRDYRPADLMFFGNADTGRVTHVALYDSEGRYVHSSGRVKRNSVDPQSPDYLYSPLHSVRIHGHEGTDGIVRAENHPWYFNLPE